MTRSLFARLSVALLVLMVGIGGGFLLIEQWSTRLYYEELTQRLNAPIAMYVTDQAELINKGQVNKLAMARLAERAMVINPSVEVYLLATNGRILAHALPADSVQLVAVDLAPVKALVDGTRAMPIRGVDPRNPGRYKVFSAHPVISEGELQGYLYVILGGKKYDELASTIRASYIGTVSFSAIIALVSAAFFVGLLVFSLLTRRLTRLSEAVQIFSDSDFAPQAIRAIDNVQSKNPGGTGADEINRLAGAVQTMANKIAELLDGLKETDRLRRELISNVSHDLRTPLASMLGYVDTLLIKNDQLDPIEREHYLEIVRSHTRRLEALIGDLFELSKLEAGSVHLNAEIFPLAELLQDVCQEFELEAAQRHILMAIEPGGERIQVCADIALVQRVLENLLRNAMNFTPDGGRVSLRLHARGDKITVAVTDTGCGIPDDQLDSIFERFFSADISRITAARNLPNIESVAPRLDHNSTGLGLAIVKRILDLHGCGITVHSIVDEGSCFEFDLPAARIA